MKALASMKEAEKCIPWYLPPMDPDMRLCSPFEARLFRKEIDSTAEKDCMVMAQL